MKNSSFLEKELNKLQFENEPETGKKYPRKLYNEFLKRANKIWPICFIKHCNEIPRRIRSMFGTFEFKKELKIYFNNKCQHPYDPNRKFCKKCMPNESDEYKNLLSEKRILHKLATNQNETSQFFRVKDCNEMFILNLIMYHHQFKWYYKKYGTLPDIKKLIDNHGYIYKDYYKEAQISFSDRKRIIL